MPELAAKAESGAIPETNPSWERQEENQSPTEGAEETQSETEGQDPASSAETLNTETAEGQDGQDGQEGQEAGEVPVDFHKHPAWQRIMKERDEAKALVEQERVRAEFYENHYNERFNAQPPNRGEQPAEKQPPSQEGKPSGLRIDPAKFPEGVKPPNKWENQEDIGKYVDFAIPEISRQTTQAEIGRAYREAILPVFQSMGQRLVAMAETMMKSQYPDFDDMVKAANEDIFSMDPSGKILGVKNQALLDYINKDLIPARALYQHGLRKKTPQKIAETKTQTTKDLLKKINTKPKGPTMPAGGTGGAPATGKLDWNSPKAEVDATLKKRGII